MKNLLLWVVSVLFNCSVYSVTCHSDYFSTKVFCTSKLHLLKTGYYCGEELSKVCPIYNEYGDEYTKNTLYWSECLETTNKSYKLYNKRYRVTNAWATVEVAQKSVGQEWLLLYYSFYRLSVIFFIYVLNLINVRAFTVVLIVYVHLPIFSVDYTCYHAYKLE